MATCFPIALNNWLDNINNNMLYEGIMQTCVYESIEHTYGGFCWHEKGNMMAAINVNAFAFEVITFARLFAAKFLDIIEHDLELPRTQRPDWKSAGSKFA